MRTEPWPAGRSRGFHRRGAQLPERHPPVRGTPRHTGGPGDRQAGGPGERACRAPVWRLVRAAAWAPYRLRYGPADALPSPRPGAGRALDIGCGRGVLLARLRAMGWDVWGIEPDAEAAAAAERAVGLPGRIARCPAEEATYPPAFFHLVTLTHSLEHLDEPLAVLTRVRRWLRPDGVLRVRVPDIGSAEARLFGHLWHGLDVPRHRHHFTASTLTLLLARAGFVVHRRVPEAQAALLAGSLATLVQVVSGRRLPPRAARALYLLTVPVAAGLAAFGIGGSIDVTAVPRS